jgi:predicted MFS family arabinose efflux permease
MNQRSAIAPPIEAAALGKRRIAHAIFSGLSATLVGIALARFAYTPLVPSLIEQHWFAADDVVFLGAANLAGYLAGALLGRPIASRVGNANTLRLMMAGVTLAFLACAWPVSIAWFFAWRFLSGLAGGAIMVLVAATVLPSIPAERKGLASGAIFLGLGLGIAGTGILVPFLLELGLREVWLGLGLLSSALTLATWHGWPPGPSPSGAAASIASLARNPVITKFLVSFALMAVGLVPPMVFLADYIARGLGMGTHAGSQYWVVYGLGAIVGPLSYTWLAERAGYRSAIRAILAVEAAAVLLLSFSEQAPVMLAMAFLIGTFPPGIVPLVLGRLGELLAHDVNAQNATWSRATTLFALTQAAAGYCCSYLFKITHGQHLILFMTAAAGMSLALAVDLIPTGRQVRGPRA